MWFRFPQGTEGISVELQSYSTEAKDAEGRCYFRAPNHFAGKILSIPGFTSVENPPDGAPDDLPQTDPLRDGAIAKFSAENENLRNENRDLRTDMSAAASKIIALANEKNDLVSENMRLKSRLEEIEEQLEDEGKVVPASIPEKKVK